MRISPALSHCALAAGLMMAVCHVPANAQTWSSSDEGGEVRTGPTYEFDYSGLLLRCERSTGRLHLRLDGSTGRYIEGSVQPLILSVAGREFRLEGIVFPSELGENYSFDRAEGRDDEPASRRAGRRAERHSRHAQRSLRGAAQGLSTGHRTLPPGLPVGLKARAISRHRPGRSPWSMKRRTKEEAASPNLASASILFHRGRTTISRRFRRKFDDTPLIGKAGALERIGTCEDQPRPEGRRAHDDQIRS